MRVFSVASALAVALLLVPSVARSQESSWDGPTPAHLAVVDGVASVSRDVNRDDAMPGLPVTPGDVIRTDRGRVEILLSDASAVDLDEFSTFELLSDTTFRLSEGRVFIDVPNNGAAIAFTIDTPQASIDITAPGQYRLALDATPSGMQTVLDVLRGEATLLNDRGSTVLRPGEQSIAVNGAAPTYARSGMNRPDALEAWATSLRNDRTPTVSAQYLPSDLRSYSRALDGSGNWNYEAPYGYVWYPTVGPDWRPYGDGYWTSAPAFGWTWIGGSRWSWPTHHYGRWGFARSRWYWIPGRRWAPAWVSWGGAPGYVSWSPLGYNNLPVFGLSVSNGYGYGWGSGWTVIGRNYFGNPRWNVRQYSIRGGYSRAPFALQAAAAPSWPRSTGGWTAGSRNVGRPGTATRPGAFGPRGGSVGGTADRSRPGDRGGVASGTPARGGSIGGPSRSGAPSGVRAVPRDGGAPRRGDPGTGTRGGRINGGREAGSPPAAAPPSSGGAIRSRSRDGGAGGGRGPSGGGTRSGPSVRSSGGAAGGGSIGRAVPRSGNGGGSTAGGGRSQGRRR